MKETPSFNLEHDFLEVLGTFTVKEIPEKNLWIAVLERGLLDYTRLYLRNKKKALKSFERVNYIAAHEWIFADDQEYWTMENICDEIFDDPEASIQKIRKIFKTDPLIFWIGTNKKSLQKNTVPPLTRY